MEYEDHNCTSNENNNAHTITFEHDIKTKLEICNYSETTKINNTWKILQHFQHKYPTLRETAIKRWIQLGSEYFKAQINKTGPQKKRIRTQHGYFNKIESILVDEIIKSEHEGFIRDIEWTRKRAKELHGQYRAFRKSCSF